MRQYKDLAVKDPRMGVFNLNSLRTDCKMSRWALQTRPRDEPRQGGSAARTRGLDTAARRRPRRIQASFEAGPHRGCTPPNPVNRGGTRDREDGRLGRLREDTMGPATRVWHHR